ncbi:MAG TPA: thioredoxin [Gemmatimonadales bacterium]
MAHVRIPCQFCGTVNAVDAARHGDGPKCASCGKPFLLDRPIKVSEEQFDDTVLKSGIPVLVDFYADWCGPCRMMAPALDEIARAEAGNLLVVKVDTDRSPALSARYGIRSIPFFGRFENGQLTKTAVGAVGREGLAELAGQPVGR